MNDSHLSAAHMEEELRRELVAGERLVWAGRPLRGLRFRPADTFLVPFSIAWAGFAIFWEIGVSTSKAPAEFPLFGIPFVLVGIYITIGRFFVDARSRERTLYGLTDRRAIIISGILGRRVQSIDPRTISELGFSEGTHGTGTITFGSTGLGSSWVNGSAWPGASRYAVPQFEFIEDARSVYEQARAVQLERKGSA